MEIVNLPLSNGEVRDDYENAVLIPLLKNIFPGQDFLKTISGIFLSFKAFGKVIASRLHSHMTNNDLYGKLQSSCSKFHSTETTLVCYIDDSKSVLPIMLDLSAGFGTVDHDILLKILKSGLGICGTA